MKLLANKMLVLTDEKQILCVYPYRDSDHSKIYLPTQNVVIVRYGALGITQDNLKTAVEKTLAYFKNVSDRKML